MRQKELNAWAMSLTVDKEYGIGVCSIYADRQDEAGDFAQTTIDDLDTFDIMLITRHLGEPVWDIDFKLWTLESLKKSGIVNCDTPDDAAQELDVEPYRPTDFEVYCKLYPVGDANNVKNIDGDYIRKEHDFYNRVKQGFDELDAKVPIEEVMAHQSEEGKEIIRESFRNPRD